MERFVLLIKKHKAFGYIFLPYFVDYEKKEGKYVINRRILPDHPDPAIEQLSEIQRRIIRITGEYEDHALRKIFHKDPRINLKEFFQSLDQKKIVHFIRPYIEEKLVAIARLLKKADTEIYLHESSSSGIYHEDCIIPDHEQIFVEFHFIKKDEGTEYFISLHKAEKEIFLKDKSHIILANKPCVLLMEGKLYLLEDMEGKKLKPFFSKDTINIPVQLEKKYYRTFILDALLHYQVITEGFDVTDRHPGPVPELTLETGMNGLLVLILTFRYDDLVIRANQTRKVFVTLQEERNRDYRFFRIFRDEKEERKKIAVLQQLGFTEDIPGIFLPAGKSRDPASQHYEMITFLNRVAEEMKREGFIIHRKTDKEYLLDPVRIEMQSKVHDSDDRLIDWVDLRAEVQFGSYRIPFIRLKDHILNKIREYVLPDGSVAVIPEEWFAEYEDLLQFGEFNGEEIRIRKHHLSLLEKTPGVADRHDIQNRIISMLEKQEAYPLPEGFNADMRPYQRKGYGWMMNLRKYGFGGCLADDMGLGKTVQSIALIRKITKHKNNTGMSFPGGREPPKDEAIQLNLFEEQSTKKQYTGEEPATLSLIVVPKSLVFNWVEEINRFAPGLRVFVYAGTNREKYFEYFDVYDVVLVTYGLLRKDIALFARRVFDLVVLDESRYIKNPDSLIFKAVMQISASQKIVLTGTPVENSLNDLWAQMQFINPGLLGSYRFFQDKFVFPVEKQQDEKVLQKLRLLIQPFILRRTKEEVASDLPDLAVQRIFTEMSDDQQHFYEEEKAKVRNAVLKLMSEGGASSMMIPVLQGLTRLRLAANHPVLVDPSYPGDSGKFEEAIEMIHTVASEGHKILIFSSFVKILQLFEHQFRKEGVPYVMLTGSVTQTKRKEAVKQFQEREDIRIFLISIMAGGFGLNLVAADYVMILDPWWNPAVERQAVDRTHRIGQSRKVMVYKMISKDSIEEKIMLYQQKKAHLAANIMQTEESLLKKLSKEEISGLFE